MSAPPAPVRPRRDDRVRAVEWRDLVPMSRGEVLRELTLSLPWIGLSLAGWHLVASRSPLWLPVAVLGSCYLFLAGLRQVHGAHHYSLGVSRRAHDLLMAALSVVMMSSMHAIQVTHLHHHRHCLGPDDVEGASARRPWHRALLDGPLFFLRLHVAAFRLDRRGRARPWILLEFALMAGFAVAAFAALDVAALRLHVAAMLVGQCLTGFFAVWTVHHDCDGAVGRTQRGRWKNRLSLNMFFHVEHHLFPAVPTCHQPELARRLEAAAPDLRERQVY